MDRRRYLLALGSVPLMTWLTPMGGAPQTRRPEPLGLGEAFEDVPPGYAGLLNVRTDLPGIAFQTATGQRYAGMNWYNTRGERMVTLATDEPDEELSLYVKADERGSGNTQPRKALDVQFGTAESIVSWKNFDILELLGGTSEQHSGNATLALHAGLPEGDTQVSHFDSEGNRRWSLATDTSRGGELQVYDDSISERILAFEPERQGINALNTPLFGLREIEQPTPDDLRSQEWAWDATDSRWLYKDSDDAVHFFTPDGRL